MNYYRLMTITAGIMLTLGLALSSYGGMLTSFFEPAYFPQPTVEDAAAMSYWSGISFMRMFGVMLIGMGSLALITRSLESVEAQQAITFSLFVINMLGLLMALTQQIAIWNKTAGWLIVGSFLLLGASFGYLRFVKEWSQVEIGQMASEGS